MYSCIILLRDLRSCAFCFILFISNYVIKVKIMFDLSVIMKRNQAFLKRILYFFFNLNVKPNHAFFEMENLSTYAMAKHGHPQI